MYVPAALHRLPTEGRRGVHPATRRETGRRPCPGGKRGGERAENALLTFDGVANDIIQDTIDGNFKFHKQITDEPDFEKFFLGWLFERYKQRSGKEVG